MLSVFLLQLLLSGLFPANGSPLDTLDSRAVNFLLATNSTSSPVIQYVYTTDYRSTWNILWSCLSVIFACTWTATHPNVYGYGSTQWQRTKRRTVLFLLALFMPEVNLLWSIKQWIGAREITRRMKVDQEEMSSRDTENIGTPGKLRFCW